MDPIRRAIREKDVAKLCDALFDADIYDQEGQQDIIQAIAFDEEDRVIITAPTRYGKTWAVALGVALYLVLHRGRTINEVAPVLKQARKFRTYLVDFVLQCPLLRDHLDVNATGVQRMRKEVSKRRITFQDGNEVRILTAGGSDTAKSLMGEGGDLIVLDESCDINDEVYRKRISRMLGDSPDAQLVEIGNPWTKGNHFFDHWENTSRFHRIWIDWEQAVAEGRLDPGFVEEQRQELTDTEFQILYDAEFPDTIEGGLIQYSWIQEARDRTIEFEDDIKVCGQDVADEGGDLNVLTKVFTDGDRFRLQGQSHWQKGDTMTTVGNILERTHGHEVMNVDAIGIGSGVAARLKEKGYDTNAVNVASGPTREKDKYVNQKAQFYWRLRKLFEDGRISIPEELGDDNELVRQLTSIRWEPRSDGKRKIIDPEEGSPDFADSLMLAVSRTTGGGGTGRVGI